MGELTISSALGKAAHRHDRWYGTYGPQSDLDRPRSKTVVRLSLVRFVLRW